MTVGQLMKGGELGKQVATCISVLILLDAMYMFTFGRMIPLAAHYQKDAIKIPPPILSGGLSSSMDSSPLLSKTDSLRGNGGRSHNNNMCEYSCKYTADQDELDPDHPLICYSFWHFHYDEEEGEYNIMFNPSPHTTGKCLDHMRSSKKALMRYVCSLCERPQKMWQEHLSSRSSYSEVVKEAASQVPVGAGGTLTKSSQRGVVYTGSVGHIRSIFVSISLLRHRSNSTLPIEVFIPLEYIDRCQQMADMFADTTCRIAPEDLPPYENKPFAIIHSSFDEVLFMDADNFPFETDPALLFDTPEFKETGALFWPDLWGHACIHTSNHIKDKKSSFYQNYPLSMRNEFRSLAGQSTWPDHVVWRYCDVEWQPSWQVAQEFESGQLIVDKKRHKSPLLLANYLTADNFAQNVLYGDKDCFRFAWLMLGGQQSYTLIKDKPVQMGTFRENGRGPYEREYLAQRYNNSIYFVHQKYKTDRKEGVKKLLIPKEGFVWKESSAFKYSYCPPNYDNLPKEDVTEKEFHIVNDTTEEFNAAWGIFFDQGQKFA